MVKVLETIDLSYKDFKDINLSFNSNTYYSIIGSNNCGKTTLFKLITGLIPSNDMIYCDEIPLNRDNIDEYITNIGIVNRVNRNSFIYNTVIDEMMYPLHNLGYSKGNALTRIKEVLSYFNASLFLDKKISELDYYEKELLLIMIAILHKPKVLLLDSVLDIFSKSMKDKINKVLRKLIEEGMTVINFTSSLDNISYSDNIILIDKFKIVGKYTPKDIYENDKLFYEHNLEIPFLTDLSIKLKMYNLLDKEYFDMKEMVDDLWP